MNAEMSAVHQELASKSLLLSKKDETVHHLIERQSSLGKLLTSNTKVCTCMHAGAYERCVAVRGSVQLIGASLSDVMSLSIAGGARLVSLRQTSARHRRNNSCTRYGLPGIPWREARPER